MEQACPCEGRRARMKNTQTMHVNAQTGTLANGRRNTLFGASVRLHVEKPYHGFGT